MDPLTALDKAKNLFLESLDHPEYRTLRVVIHETSQSHTLWRYEGPVPKEPVEPAYVSGRWEIMFSKFVSYSIQDEFYKPPDDSEQWSGNRLRFYSKSKFHDYVKSFTMGRHEAYGGTAHFCLVMEDYVIDVVATTRPQVRSLDPYAPATKRWSISEVR